MGVSLCLVKRSLAVVLHCKRDIGRVQIAGSSFTPRDDCIVQVRHEMAKIRRAYLAENQLPQLSFLHIHLPNSAAGQLNVKVRYIRLAFVSFFCPRIWLESIFGTPNGIIM